MWDVGGEWGLGGDENGDVCEGTGYQKKKLVL